MTEQKEAIKFQYSKIMKKIKNNYDEKITALGKKIGKTDEEIAQALKNAPLLYDLLKSYYAQAYKMGHVESEEEIRKLSAQFYFGIFDRLGAIFKIDGKTNGILSQQDINHQSIEVRLSLANFLNKPTPENAKKYISLVHQYIRVLEITAGQYHMLKLNLGEEITRQKQALKEVGRLVKEGKLSSDTTAYNVISSDALLALIKDSESENEKIEKERIETVKKTFRDNNISFDEPKDTADAVELGALKKNPVADQNNPESKLDNEFKRLVQSVANNIKASKMITKEGFIDQIKRKAQRSSNKSSQITEARKKLVGLLTGALKSSHNSIDKAIECLNICSNFISKNKLEDAELIRFSEHLHSQFYKFLEDHKKEIKSLYASDAEKMQEIYSALGQKDNNDIVKQARNKSNSLYGKFCEAVSSIEEMHKANFGKVLDLIPECKTRKDYDDLLSFAQRLIGQFSEIDTLRSRHYRDILADVCHEIIKIHYLKDAQDIRLDFSVDQLENAKQMLDLIGACRKSNRTISQDMEGLEQKITEKNKDVHGIEHLMLYIPPQKTGIASHFSSENVSKIDQDKLEAFRKKLNQSMVAHTLADNVISTGRVKVMLSHHATVATGAISAIDFVKPLPIPSDTLNKGVEALDQLHQQVLGNNAVEAMDDFQEWLKVIKNKLVPLICKMFEANILNMKSEKEIKRFAEFCQKRMFNAIRSGDIKDTTQEKGIRRLICAIYQDKYDDLFDSFNPLYGRFHRNEDNSFLGKSTFQEMLENAPLATLLKSNYMGMYFNLNAISADDDGKMHYDAYSLVDLTQDDLQDLAKKIAKTTGKRSYGFQPSSSDAASSPASLYRLDHENSVTKKRSKKSDRTLSEGGKTLAEYVEEQSLRQGIGIRGSAA